MIKVYDAFTDDFSGQGLGYIMPTRADVEEEPAGMYEIELEIPINDSRDDWIIDHQRIIAAKSPTRTSPEINFGLDGMIQRQIYKTTKAAYMYNLSNKKKKLKKYGKNVEFVRLEIDGEWYKVSAVKGGKTGWMKADIFEYVREAEDNISSDNASRVIENVLAQEQLFRIYYIKRDAEQLILTAAAEHITYDLKGVIVEKTYAPENIPADEVVAQLIAKADRTDLPFNIYCECTDLITGDYTGRNLIDCLLNSDDGIVAQCGARFIRDNFSVYILKPYDRYTGAEIRYGDNMQKASLETDSADCITRIRPVGKNKKGEPLYISENNGYVDSPNADQFAVQRTKQIAYSEAYTGRNGLKSDAQTREKLKELAQKEFENGIDAIAGKIDAKFVRRELTEEFKNLANEAALHMYDIARVRAGRAGIKSDVRMTAYKFDALPGREKYSDTKITDIAAVDPMIYGINIGGNSISGAKIANNSIDGSSKLKELSVGIGKFDLATIDQLNANSITALIARINEIVAGEITTDELYAAFAEIVGLKVGSLTAADIETDRLAAALAAFTVVAAGTAEFDLATVTNLLSNALILKQGYADSMQIVNLAITSANILSATLGELVVKGEDGNYYQVTVNASGSLKTQQVTVSEDEIDAGQTTDGRQIIASTANVASLNATNISASGAIIAEIFTEALNAGKITAAQATLASATIPELYTTAVNALGNSMSFSANDLIQFILGNQNEMQRWFTFDDSKGFTIRKPGYTDQNGVIHPASIWSTVTDETGYHIKRSDIPGYIASFHKEQLDAKAVSMGGIVCREMYGGGWIWTEE